MPRLTMLFLAFLTFLATITSFHFSRQIQTSHLRRQNQMMSDMSVEEISSKYKRIVYGQGPAAKIGLEIADRAYKTKTLDFELDRRKGGSLG